MAIENENTLTASSKTTKQKLKKTKQGKARHVHQAIRKISNQLDRKSKSSVEHLLPRALAAVDYPCQIDKFSLP